MNREEIISNLVAAFVLKSQRDRVQSFLLNQKKRAKMIGQINKDWQSVFDPQRFTPILKGVHSPERIIENVGIKREALCYTLSVFEEYDDKIWGFEYAIKHIASGAAGILLYDFKKNIVFIEEEQEKGASRRFIGMT